MTNTRPKPIILCILDGWGHREEAADDNAIAQADTPNWDHVLSSYPHGVIHASEQHVGLPAGQMGNSEVGHMNIGAGRIVMQDLPRIDQAINTGELAQNPQLHSFIATLKQSGGAYHLMGLLSDGGVHAHMDHILALAHIIAQEGTMVWLHAFLDGRDTPPQSAGDYLHRTQQMIADESNIRLATLCGRYYAMDRDTRWDRTEQAYNMLVSAEGDIAADAHATIVINYEIHGTTDEFIKPCVLKGYTGMQDGDGLLMANFRADRARQLLTALLDPAFDGFERERVVSFASSCGMVEYSNALSAFLPALFPPVPLTATLGEVIAQHGLTQLRIAETEKYAHVTFFFNGGRETVYDGEERIMVPSPDVATYDLKPDMSACEVTDALINAIEEDRFDVIIVNYANTDMVGHTGKLDAAIKAVEAVDTCLGRLLEAIEQAGGAMIITADHGNVEHMQDHASGQSHTAHTTNLVPVVVLRRDLKESSLLIREGKLADLAPTMLDLLQLPIPDAMTGTSLLSDATDVQSKTA